MLLTIPSKADKILLINPAFVFNSNAIKRRDQNDFPLNLGLLASVLLNNNYKVRIINANTTPNWQEVILQIIDAENILYIGFTVMSSQVKPALTLAKKIKTEKNIPILFGGVHSTLMPESLLKTGLVDFCNINEGDKTVIALAKHLKGEIPLEQVPNIATLKDGKLAKTAEAEPTPFIELPKRIEVSLYKEDIDEYAKYPFPLLTGLGCNYKCAFCINTIVKRKYRAKSAKAIYDEIKGLYKEYKITQFVFQDEHFFYDKARFFDLLYLIENDKEIYKKITWETTARATDIREDYLNVNLLKRIKRAGCKGLGVGGESGNKRVLRELRKGITPEDMRRAAKYCNEARININFSFVMLWPSETALEMLETARIINELLEIGEYVAVPYFQTYRPYPGSIWEQDLSKFEDPEKIPAELWRMQLITKDKLAAFKDSDLVYNIILTTQVLCNCAKEPPGNRLKKAIAKTIYAMCQKRIGTGNFKGFIEKPILSYIQKRTDEF